MQKVNTRDVETCSFGKLHLAKNIKKMRPIRTAARALIILKDRLLTIKMRDASGIFYILPGGGQRHGETLQQGLKRECLEEIGTEVEIGPLLYVREYIGKNHEFHKAHRAFHQVEHVFRCTLPTPDAIGPGTEHDKKQVGIEWIPLAELAQRRFLPEAIKAFFKNGDFDAGTLYLGDIN
ncbi:MAG: NUDIX domain-containing protein [Puniceicoccaceae bacterium]|nr:MAG: NUDIX domain-containing protein [Puniceicoccaceae bacterium]